ncbi:MAG: fructose-bisphosphate aldolase [Myxococcota bacterium]
MSIVSGKSRLRRLFRADGRVLVVAMDHLSKPGRGMRCTDPGRVLSEATAAGADAVLLRHGLVDRYAGSLERMGVILSVGRDAPNLDHAVELALRLGADAVKADMFPGAPDPSAWAYVEPLAARCATWGMPLMAETIPVSFGASDAHTPGNLIDSARMGSDLGADIIKTMYTGDPASFRELVSFAGVPVIVLGGSSADGDARTFFTTIKTALDAGAAGAAVGRRIWQSERPGAMTGALARLIHEEVSVDAAIAELDRVVVGPR